MSDFHIFVNEQLQDPEFRVEYDAAYPEYEITRLQIADRIAADIRSYKPILIKSSKDIT